MCAPSLPALPHASLWLSLSSPLPASCPRRLTPTLQSNELTVAAQHIPPPSLATASCPPPPPCTPSPLTNLPSSCFPPPPPPPAHPPPPLQEAKGQEAAAAAWQSTGVSLEQLLPSFANGPADIQKVVAKYGVEFLVGA